MFKFIEIKYSISLKLNRVADRGRQDLILLKLNDDEQQFRDN